MLVYTVACSFNNEKNSLHNQSVFSGFSYCFVVRIHCEKTTHWHCHAHQTDFLQIMIMNRHVHTLDSFVCVQHSNSNTQQRFQIRLCVRPTNDRWISWVKCIGLQAPVSRFVFIESKEKKSKKNCENLLD